MQQPPAEIRVVDFEVIRVNETRERVRPGGSAPLCQSITPVAIEVHLRWRLPRPTSAKVTVRYPRGTTRRHRLRLTPRRAGATLELSPQGERLPGDHFWLGPIDVLVRIPGHTTAGRMRFTGRTVC